MIINFKSLLICTVLCLISNAVSAQSLIDQINQSSIQFLQKDGYALQDYVEMEVSDHYYSKNLGIYHTYYQQFYKGIPVDNGILNTAFRNGKLVNSNAGFAKNIQVDTSKIKSVMSPERGLKAALDHLNIETRLLPRQKSSRNGKFGKNQIYVFEKTNISKIDMNVYLVWVKEGNSLRLCWENEVEPTSSNKEHFIIQVDAFTGEFVNKQNRIIECQFDHNRFENHNDHNHNSNQKIIQKTASGISMANSYTVFDLPVESPSHGSRTITSSPWSRTGPSNPASTLGWHNDGVGYTITRGNNVYAYEDQNADNNPGYSPNGGGGLDFNFPLNLSNAPATNIDAAITNLFHTSNLVHDITYQYGFDEVAGNFQKNNLSRGGAQSDPVLAEALDGSGFDNANFSITADGTSGRMQMFLWDTVSLPIEIVVNFPNSLPSPISSVESAFSTANKLKNVGPKNGQIIVAKDTTSNPSHACSPLINGASMSGKIALIDRGTCNFTTKVLNAQISGAIAAIVINSNQTQSPFAMAGEDNSITIPAVMISYADGQLLKNALVSDTVNLTIAFNGEVSPDGSYDNGIIVHEYGHGISNRLTGGPAAAGCLVNQEQMGEGWSDYLALMLTTNWSSALDTMRRGIGTYVIGEMPNGTGIRTYPYTTNMAVNPFTYTDVAAAPLIAVNTPSPHFIGSIWASMLWDMTWNIIDLEGIDTDIYQGTGGNNIALELVIAGMKLQPCSPGFVDGRDAILLADEILYGGAHRCAIWKAFAQRGLGLSASQGLSSSFTDGVAAFNQPSGVTIIKTLDKLTAYEGESITIKSKAVCRCTATPNFQLKNEIPAGYEITNVVRGTLVGNNVLSNLTALQVEEEDSIVYTIKVKNCSGAQELNTFYDEVQGAAKFTSSKLAGTGTKSWVTSTAQSNSAPGSWYGVNYADQSDYVLTQNANLAISQITRLSFYHKFNTEENWDGGVVEISLNNGGWIDLGPYFLKNGYPSFFASNGSSSLAGRLGFTGDSNIFFGSSAFIESVVDLSSFAGNNVRIRFRFASDINTAATGINGWHVDDIRFNVYNGGISNSISTSNNVPLDTLSVGLASLGLTQKTIFVDGNAVGLNFGGTWPNAFPNLKDALQVAVCHQMDSIFIAEGIYSPSNNRDSSFILTDTIKLFGGFATGGTPFASRNPSLNETILSGDIGSLGNTSDNTFHIAKIPVNAVVTLDGLILEKGNANGAGEQNKGAAIYNQGKVILENTILRSNAGGSSTYNLPGALIEVSGMTKM